MFLQSPYKLLLKFLKVFLFMFSVISFRFFFVSFLFNETRTLLTIFFAFAVQIKFWEMYEFCFTREKKSDNENNRKPWIRKNVEYNGLLFGKPLQSAVEPQIKWNRLLLLFQGYVWVSHLYFEFQVSHCEDNIHNLKQKLSDKQKEVRSDFSLWRC